MKLVTDLHILNVTLSEQTNSITASLGDVFNSTDPEIVGAEYIQQVGLCTLPPNPIPGQRSADAIVFRADNNNRDFVIATRDVASQNNYGHLGPGESILYGAGADGNSQGRVVIKSDGSVTMYTTDTNTEDGNGVYTQVSPTAISWVAPWGKVIFNANGFFITHASGASMKMGALSAPTPLDSLSSYCQINCATTTINSAVRLGTGSVYLPAATSPLAGLPQPPFSGTGSSTVQIGV